MEAKGLSQKDLAEVLGVTLDRVKSLTSGRVKKLAPDEAKALVEELKVRGEYIATGSPPIFKSPAELELDRRLSAISTATDVARNVQDKQARGAVQEGVFRALVESLTTEEQRLVQSFRACSKSDQETVLGLAERLAASKYPKKARK